MGGLTLISAVAALWMAPAGCGGAIQPDELRRGVEMTNGGGG